VAEHKIEAKKKMRMERKKKKKKKKKDEAAEGEDAAGTGVSFSCTLYCDLYSWWMLRLLLAQFQLEKEIVRKGKGTKAKGSICYSAPSIDTATSEALRYIARTKQRRTFLP